MNMASVRSVEQQFVVETTTGKPVSIRLARGQQKVVDLVLAL
jgi:hypothetical protein